MAKIFKPSGRKSGTGSRKAHSALGSYKLDILRFADDGRGIAIRADDKVVFVEGALPGETVNAELTRRHKRFDEARSVEVLSSPSAARVEPECGVYERCGGCQLQHLSYDEQLAYKQQRLQKVLDELSCGVLAEIMPAQPYRYRHRARLSYRLGHLGFRRRASHHVEGFSHCPVLMPELDSAIKHAMASLPAALKASKSAELHFALGYNDTDETVIVLSIEDQLERRIAWCQDLAARLAPQLVLQSVVSPAGEWRNPDAHPLNYGSSDVAPRYSGFYAGDFTQVNPLINRQIVDQCVAWLAPREGDIIADYFCGLGNFSFPLAQCGARVVGIDAGSEMIGRARQAQEARGTSLAAQFQVSDLFQAEQLMLAEGARKAVLDPPRAGAKALCERLAVQAELREIVYVSCDPATLARDLAILVNGGFKIRSAISADMFPQTYHMESMVYLLRG